MEESKKNKGGVKTPSYHTKSFTVFLSSCISQIHSSRKNTPLHRPTYGNAGNPEKCANIDQRSDQQNACERPLYQEFILLESTRGRTLNNGVHSLLVESSYRWSAEFDRLSSAQLQTPTLKNRISNNNLMHMKLVAENLSSRQLFGTYTRVGKNANIF
ncbi:hypothetical protein AVEN_30579-1 [Araneus ventricosus]|uniref:Uncharacterized protein n=1 Tax=Araneus ventricosus TaxID=182803 RepID=A0A4Y2EQF9_ARAVE|nr:hypothetical protein AVEN_30579-1 [Araneus ventricosus]